MGHRAALRHPVRACVPQRGVSVARSNLRTDRLLLTVVLTAAAALAAAPAANASCAEPPAESAHAFVGTVIDTRADDRVAAVITDDGRRVTVLGASDDNPYGSFSSVDRRYTSGARYEFHPINASDPYRDNACTATHEVTGPGPQPLEPGSDMPGWLPVDEQAGPVGYVLFFGPLVGAALGLALLGRFLWRRRRQCRRY
jgi:hypothetical protein